MSVFYDDDLKRLKVSIDTASNSEDLKVDSKEKWRALLVRLDSAEDLCQLIGKADLRNIADNELLAIHKYYFYWRKAAGK